MHQSVNTTTRAKRQHTNVRAHARVITTGPAHMTTVCPCVGRAGHADCAPRVRACMWTRASAGNAAAGAAAAVSGGGPYCTGESVLHTRVAGPGYVHGARVRVLVPHWLRVAVRPEQGKVEGRPRGDHALVVQPDADGDVGRAIHLAGQHGLPTQRAVLLPGPARGCTHVGTQC